MNGLVLSGGGVRGSYQIGAYYALKKCHIKIHGFMGTSIGAFNAAVLASHQEEKLLNFWQTADVGKILGFTKKLSEQVNNDQKDIKLVIEIFKNIKNIALNKGINTRFLKETIESFNLKEKLYKTNKEFGLVTVRFRDFSPKYMFKKDIKPELLNDYIIASCYLPIFKFEKIIDNDYYLDGGFHDYIPANALLEKGYKKIYIVDLEAIGLRRPYQDKKRLVIIKPSRNLGSILNINHSDITNNIKLGYYDTLKIIKKLDGYKYIFKVRKNWFYKYLLRKVDSITLQKMQTKFFTKNPKKLIIKACEYIMKKENYSYYNVYNISSVINSIKRENKDNEVYKFISKIKTF